MDLKGGGNGIRFNRNELKRYLYVLNFRAFASFNQLTVPFRGSFPATFSLINALLARFAAAAVTPEPKTRLMRLYPLC